MLAQSQGSAEIGIDHLLEALDGNSTSGEPVVTPDEPRLPLTKLDLPLSIEAAAALAQFKDIPDMPLDLLRTVLLAAKA